MIVQLQRSMINYEITINMKFSISTFIDQLQLRLISFNINRQFQHKKGNSTFSNKFQKQLVDSTLTNQLNNN